jgi:hypothetical protein
VDFAAKQAWADLLASTPEKERDFVNMPTVIQSSFALRDRYLHSREPASAARRKGAAALPNVPFQGSPFAFPVASPYPQYPFLPPSIHMTSPQYPFSMTSPQYSFLSPSLYHAADKHGHPPDQIQQGKCAICHDRLPTQITLPCGHLCFCIECKESFEKRVRDKTMNPNCPVCRQPFTVIQPVYMT